MTTKYKIGDHVKMLTGCGLFYNKGDVGIIVRLKTKDRPYYQVDFTGNKKVYLGFNGKSPPVWEVWPAHLSLAAIIPDTEFVI